MVDTELSQEEVTAEVFRVIRNSDSQNPKTILSRIKEHLPMATQGQITKALKQLLGLQQ